MRTFLVERDLAGVSAADLLCLAAATMREASRMRDLGDRVHYLGSTCLPQDGRCLCLFEARDEEVLISLNRSANLPVERILPAIALAQGPLGRL